MMSTLTTDQRLRLIDAALGRRPLDLVVRGAKLLDVYRGGWIEGDLGVAEGRIAAFGASGLEGEEEVDASGKWVVPGFFESHYHAGGTHLAPNQLARAFLRRGTTASVCDFQEFYVVGGLETVRLAIDETWNSGLKLFYLAPTQHFVINHLAAEQRQMPIQDMFAMLAWPETVAINEPPPGPVMANASDILDVIDATFRHGKVYAGHAPGMTGRQLQAYITTGASSDHESQTADEAWAKLAYGMCIMMRYGSASPDMDRLLPLAIEQPLASRHMMLSSDEVDPNDLIEHGHLDFKVKRAIASGVDRVIAYQMVTLNPAEYYHLEHEIGSLAPGRHGDFVILRDPDMVTIDAVYASGRPVGEESSQDLSSASRPASLSVPLDFSRPLRDTDFQVSAPGAQAEVRVIVIGEGSLVSEEGRARVPVVDGNARPDPTQDVAKLAVIERSNAPEIRSVGFTQGFEIAAGAVATTYAHTFYNLLVVGTNEALMARAANEVAEMGGGVAVVDGEGAVIARWNLDLVGVFSSADPDTVRQDFNHTNAAIAEIGSSLASPLLALSFVALPTIPALGLTHAGLYDVAEQEYIDVVIG